MEEYINIDLAIKVMQSLVEYYGGNDVRSVYCNMAKECLEKQNVKPYKYDYICPTCGSYNEIFKHREATVKKDKAYCWHCGQRVQLN